jgi:dihydrolipoamide dehydrogenase
MKDEEYMVSYDLLVIGMGAAFQVLDAALDRGLRCAVAERAHYGGTCLNYGCIPSKVIITVADTIRHLERAAKTGLKTAKPEVDFAVLKARVLEKTSENLDIREEYRAETNLTMYEDVCFVGKKTVAARFADGSTGEPFTAKTIVIGAGGHITIPSIEGIGDVDFMTPVHFFKDRFPDGPLDDVVIIGGGAIGCEFAHFFAATGTRVTILQRNVRLAPGLDRELSFALKDGLERDGVQVALCSDVKRTRRLPNGRIEVTWEDRNTQMLHQTETGMVFLASGITSNALDLGADRAGILLDENFYIRTNEFLETSEPGIYAIGDINGLAQFRHKANYEIETLTHNLFFREEGEPRRQVQYGTVPACIFSHPQVASVGLTEEEALEQGYDMKIGRLALADVVKGFALGLEDTPADGFVKMIVDSETDRILGVHIAGHEAALLLQPFAYLMQSGANRRVVHNPEIGSQLTMLERGAYRTMTIPSNSVQLIERSVVIHPALSEAPAWVTANLVPRAEYEPRR